MTFHVHFHVLSRSLFLLKRTRSLTFFILILHFCYIYDDRDKLLLRLDSDFGVCGMASTWFRSYLTGRTCYVAMGDLKSDVWSCDSGVPQGSVLGPVLFSAFVSPISRIMESHGIMYHQYADDTQLYTEVRSLVPSEMEALAQCVSALTFWFLDNGLQLNSSKSEAMILGSRQGLSRMEPVGSLVIGDDRVEVRDDIKILGVHLDPTLSMNAQVKAVIKASNFHIRALRHVRRGLTLESTKMIALGLVTSRLDYCNSLLYGTSKTNTAKLQRVQNDLARVVLRAAWNSSSKPLLKQLHWLPVQQRITFKIALITFNVRSSEQPSYLHSLLGQLRTITEPEVRGTASPPSSIPKIGCRQTQLLLRRADHLE